MKCFEISLVSLLFFDLSALCLSVCLSVSEPSELKLPDSTFGLWLT